MFLRISIVGCAILSIVPHATRCEGDAGMEDGFVRKSKSYGSDMSTKDIDSDESRSSSSSSGGGGGGGSSNINVNVNSNDPLDWHQPQTYRTNGRLNSQRGIGLRKTLNEFMPRIRLPPNSNIDFNFAHPDGNVRLSRNRASKIPMSQWTSSEDLEPSGEEDEEEEDPTACYPLVRRIVEHLKRLDRNMVDLENELSAFLLR